MNTAIKLNGNFKFIVKRKMVDISSQQVEDFSTIISTFALYRPHHRWRKRLKVTKLNVLNQKINFAYYHLYCLILFLNRSECGVVGVFTLLCEQGIEIASQNLCPPPVTGSKSSSHELISTATTQQILPKHK